MSVNKNESGEGQQGEGLPTATPEELAWLDASLGTAWHERELRQRAQVDLAVAEAEVIILRARCAVLERAISGAVSMLRERP